MKTNFRKVVGLLLAVVMVFSVCTVAFAATTPSTELTINDFGVTGGESTPKIVDDPVNAGEKALKLDASGGEHGFRANIELADPTDTSKKLEPVAGTTYTVSFDYYYNEATTTSGFTLYYGAQSLYSDKYSKVSISSVNSGIGNERGKWCSATMIFTAATATGEVNGVDGQALPYLYLTYYAETNKVIDGYIKNIKISVGEDVRREYAGDTSHFIKADGSFEVGFKYGSETPFTNNRCKFGEDGTFIYVPDNSSNYNTGTSLPKAVGSQYLKMFNKETNSKIVLKPGRTYYVALNYEVRKLGNNSYAGIAVGYNYSSGGEGVSTNGWASTYLVDGKVHTSVTTGKQTLVCKFDYTSTSNGDLIMCFSGNMAEIALYDYTVTEISTTSEKYAFVSYNDNGNVTIVAETVGAPVTKVGNNKYNVETLKEEFIGWYADPQFTTPVTKVTTEHTTLYAKYPSVIIDFNHRDAYDGSDNYGINDTNKNSVTDGVYTYTSNNTNVGFVLPSYDAAIKAAADKKAFYQFKDGYDYKITLVINKSAVGCTPRFTPSTSAGIAGGRVQSYEKILPSIPAVTEPTTVEYEFTFNYPAQDKASNYQDFNIYTFRNFGNGNVVEFDKIIITQVTGMDQYKLGSVTFVDGDKVVATSTDTDKFICPPTPNTPEGKLFIGWYDASYKVNTQATKSAASAPVSFAKVTKGVHATYEARYIDSTVTVIDFDIYGNKTGWTDYLVASSSERSKNVKVTDFGDGDYYLETKHVENKDFKSSLFNANGEKFFVYEGVKYSVTVEYEVNNDAANCAAEGSFIGLTRNTVNAYMPHTVKFDDGDTRLETLADATKLGKHTVTKSFTVSDIHVAYNGSVEGGADARQTELSLLLHGGAVKVYSVEITPVSYTPVFAPEYDASKGDVTYFIDSDGSVNVTATPKNGNVLAANGVKVVRTFKSFVKSEDDKQVIVTDGPSYGYALNTSDGKSFTFNISDLSADVLRTASIKVDFVSAGATDNAAFIGASIRNPSDTDSAGLRFRARISDVTVAAAQKIEFVAVPENVLTDCNGLIKDYTGGMSVTGVAYEKNGKNIVYDASIDGFADYQVCITDLNESAQALKIAVAVKITGADNNITWIQINNNQSFNGLK